MRNYFWGLILVSLGTLLLLDHLDVISFEDVIHDYWPLILIFWGLSILVGRRHDRHHPAPTTDASPPVDYDLLHQSSVFGDVHTDVTSSKFKGGSVSTVFGNTFVDLSKSTFDAGEHILRVSGVFGDTTLVVPKDAAVAVRGDTVFGGLTILGQHKSGIASDIRMSTPNYEGSQNRLNIRISKVFGNVNVY